jgi:PAS domain S-box-containing protein
VAQRRTPLKTLELQLGEAQQLAHFGSWEWDLVEDRITWSEALYEMMGLDPASFRPSVDTFLSLVHPEDRERVTRAATRSREQGKPYAKPFRIIRPDGAVRTLRGGSHPVTDSHGKLVRVVGILQDISEEAAAQEALRSYAGQVLVLARRLVEVQEETGRRLANELHDNLGPSLTALAINLKLIEEAVPPGQREQLADPLADSLEQIRQATAGMREVMGELRPHALDDHGLPAALRLLAEAFEKRTGIRAEVSVDGPERAADGVALPLYRIAQEALNNVAKHSRAQRVEIRYAAAASRTMLEIEDDGVGFAPGAASRDREAHWGLMTMRERAAAAGASCEIVSQPARGVLVRVAIDSENGVPARAGMTS